MDNMVGGDTKDSISCEQDDSKKIPADEYSTADQSNISTCSGRSRKHKRKCLKLDITHHRDMFVTMFYRIWMYRTRHLLLTLLQLFIPPLILIGMAFTAYPQPIPEEEWTPFSTLSEETLFSKISEGSGSATVACYIHNNETIFAQSLKAELIEMMTNSNIRVQMVDDREQLLTRYIHFHLRGEPENYIAGIEIKLPPAESFPNDTMHFEDNFTLQFSISMAQKTPGFYLAQRPLYFDLERNKPKDYNKLMGIELTMFRTFYNLIRNQTDESTNVTLPLNRTRVRKRISIEIRPLPYPPHISYAKDASSINENEEEHDDKEIDAMLSTIFVLSMVPAIFSVVEGPVTEKENGFKLFLQLMGYPRGAYWFSWILNQMFIQLFVIVAQVLLIFIPFDSNMATLIQYGDATLWGFVLVLFNLASLSFFGFLAAFFRRAKMGTYLVILIWLLTFQILQSHMPSFDLGSGISSFMLSCLVPMGCIHWAVVILTTASTNTWEASFRFTLTQQSGFKLIDVVGMLLGNFAVYFVLTLYVDNLHPGPLESGQPWNYFFEGIKCRFIDPNKDFVEYDDCSRPTETSKNSHELGRRRCSNCRREECPNKPAIEFQKLSKKFHYLSGVYGIENVKFTVYSQRITVLLGHHDSGRTTLMRLLCGEYSPTSGTALVYGYNVKKDTQKVQSFLSLCMQHNSLCEYLTVMEHMKLIGKLKGLTSKEAKDKSIKILQSLDLYKQRKDVMWKLLKWQRRVLCIAMALLGNAPILLLDEPTWDLDLDVKRQIWSLLKDLKLSGKTILMSTTDIDEAYEIADRIVIMSRGRVAGVGPPSKLEKLFETGYHLTLQILPAAKKEEILTFLQRCIPSICEMEGNLTQLKKAIQVSDWDQSQGCVFSGENPENETEPKEDEKADAVSIRKFINYFFGPVTEDEDVDITFSRLNRSESEPTVAQLGTEEDHSYITTVDIEQCHYLLRFGEEANFPKLFQSLDNSAVMFKLGIRKYEVKLHDMKTAFNEVDDYVDVLDAASNSKFETDFVDIKALRLLIDEPSLLPIHIPDDDYSSLWSIWALILKRLYHMIGNYRHVFTQVLAPILILIITNQSISSNFLHSLSSHEIIFDASTESSVSNVPYRTTNGSLSREFLESYEKVITGKRVEDSESRTKFQTKSIGTKIFNESYDDYLHQLYDEIVVAADFTQLNENNSDMNQIVTALFSSGHYNSAPLSLMFMFKAILDYEFPNKSYSVDMRGKSIFQKREWLLLTNKTFAVSLKRADVDVTLAVFLAFGYFIFTSGFVTQPVTERLSKLKRYQMYTLKWNGTYWVATAIVDMLFNLIVVILLTLVMIYIPNREIFKNPEFITLFVLTGVFGGFASILKSYIWSHFLLRTATSYYAVLSINQFFGLFMFLFHSIINFDYFGKYVGIIVTYSLQILLQPFTIPWNFHSAIIWSALHARCSVLNKTVIFEMCSTEADNYTDIKTLRGECCSGNETGWSLYFIWNDTELLSNVAILLGHCIVGVLLLMYMESRRLRKTLFNYLSKSGKAPMIKNENDLRAIMKEEKFVEEAWRGNDRDDLFILRNVGTCSDRRELLFPMTFAVEPGKCTAIVGPETSGITVLYNILSGLRAVSDGEVSYGGYSLLSKGSRRKFLCKLGLCPVADITIDKLTGQQLLKVFGMLRGISSKQLSSHIAYWVETLGLEKVIKKQCHHYSLVVKRKIAVAIAVIGNPKVIIFDEPTKDLDPMSKFQVYKVLESLVHSNRIVIVLTHDLSSIERICSKLIFLINGQVQFCESTEAIYKQIAKHFTLNVNLKMDEFGKIDVKSYAEFKTSIESQVEGITLQREQSHSLIYRIEHEKSTWASVFEKVEKITRDHSGIVSEYYIRRTSLQDVYNSYAVNQRIFRIRESAWDEFRTTYC